MAQRDEARGSRGPRRGDKGVPEQDPVRARKHAEELAAKGMPFQLAMAVAHGRLSLNDALERMARQDKVQVLMDKHDLSRALATQIALGQASLERVLANRRFLDHREQYRDRSVLAAHQQSGEPLTLGLHGGDRATVTVLEVKPYDVVVRDRDAEESREIHKLQIKYAYPADAWKRVRKGLKTDRVVQEQGLAPVTRPQDRYGCSDKRLFRYMDEKREVVVTLLEGEQLRGTITWFGRFEFGLQVKDAEVTVFRHALQDAREA